MARSTTWLLVTDSTDLVYAYDADTLGLLWRPDFRGSGVRQQLASDIVATIPGRTSAVRFDGARSVPWFCARPGVPLFGRTRRDYVRHCIRDHLGRAGDSVERTYRFGAYEALDDREVTEGLARDLYAFVLERKGVQEHVS